MIVVCLKRFLWVKFFENSSARYCDAQYDYLNVLCLFIYLVHTRNEITSIFILCNLQSETYRLLTVTYNNKHFTTHQKYGETKTRKKIPERTRKWRIKCIVWKQTKNSRIILYLSAHDDVYSTLQWKQNDLWTWQ